MKNIGRILYDREKSKTVVVGAVVLTLIVLGSSFLSLGFWTMVIISFGFVGGLLLWLTLNATVDWSKIKLPFILTFGLFIAHRIEEKFSGFFETLSSLTGVETPKIFSLPVILMVITSVGSWLLIPTLLKRGAEFGRYLLWTFFVSMGVTELAHILVFPIIVDKPFEYFPGMGSVFFLAPAAWWGIRRLSQK